MISRNSFEVAIDAISHALSTAGEFNIPELRERWKKALAEIRAELKEQKPFKLICNRCGFQGEENTAIKPVCPECCASLNVHTPPYPQTKNNQPAEQDHIPDATKETENIWQAFERVLSEHPEFDGVPAYQEIGSGWVLLSPQGHRTTMLVDLKEIDTWKRHIQWDPECETFQKMVEKLKAEGYRAIKVRLVAVEGE